MDKLHICQQCGKKCENENVLQVHIYSVHGNAPETTTDSNFQSRPGRDSSENLTPCNIVNTSSNPGNKVNYPANKEPIKENKENYVCKYCNRQFSTKWYVTEHERVHKNEKAFYCNFCNKKFTALWRMKRHMNVHTTNLPCSLCDKSFSTKYSLKTHTETVHEGKKIIYV